MAKYFTVEVIPTIAASTQVENSADDLLFDWTSFQVPRGPNKLISATVVMRGTNGSDQDTGKADLDLVFAKTIKGVAPGTLGTPNLTINAKPGVSNHIIGMTHIDASGDYGAAGFDHFSVGSTGSGAAGSLIPTCVLQGELSSGDNVGFDTLYLGGVAGNGAGSGGIDFGTGVLLDDDVDISGSNGTITTLDGTACDVAFAVGDIIHVNGTSTTDIILGEVISIDTNNIEFRHDGGTTDDPTGSYVVPADLAAWRIQNGAGAAGDLANNDELFNIHPIKIILSFER